MGFLKKILIKEIKNIGTKIINSGTNDKTIGFDQLKTGEISY
jgi:hypothetical protein